MVQKGAVDRSINLYIVDSTTGVPETGVLFSTTDLEVYYSRDNSLDVQVTTVTLAALTTIHTDGGFLERRNGVYRFDPPDAAWATGSEEVTFQGSVPGMIILPITYQFDIIEILLEADQEIDTTTIPWDLVLIKKGTGGLGVGTEMLRQAIKSTTDTNVTSIQQVPGKINT